MTNIIRFDEFQDQGIRTTPDGRYSVFDVIRLCTGNKNPSQLWNGDKAARATRQKGMVERFPEVVRITDNFKFPGRGQRETPVASREGILQIVGLLPGAVGRAYRESAAKVFLAYLDASPELAEDVIDRAKPEDLDRIQKRLISKKVRVRFVSELHDRGVVDGWQIGACTNAIYQPILGKTAKELKRDRNLPVRANLRDNLDPLDLAATMFAEELATRDMSAQDAKGFPQCQDITQKAAHKVRRAMN